MNCFGFAARESRMLSRSNLHDELTLFGKFERHATRDLGMCCRWVGGTEGGVLEANVSALSKSRFFRIGR